MRIEVDVEDTFYDFGLGDLYDQAVEELTRREEQAVAALFEAVATAEERARMEEMRAATTNVLGTEDEAERERATALMRGAQPIVQAITQRAEEAGEPLVAALASATCM